MLPARPEQKVRAMNTEVTHLHLHVSGSSPSLSSLGHLLSTYFGLGSDLSPGDTTQIIWGCELRKGPKRGWDGLTHRGGVGHGQAGGRASQVEGTV